MKKQVLLLCATLLGGFSCDPDWSDFPWPSVGLSLDQVTGNVLIVEGSDQATATAELNSSTGLPVDLADGQSVQVNGQVLSAAADAGRYAASIPLSENYSVTVTEPTRGVQSTSQPAPADFAILSPATDGPASLSGFTLTWSNPNPALQLRVTLLQTLFGQVRRADLGPSADTGSWTLSAEDLADFRQGSGLTVIVTKTAGRSDVAGFAAGRIAVERGRTVVVTPQP